MTSAQGEHRGGAAAARAAAVDVVVAHASAKSYTTQAAKTAGWTVARAEQTKRPRFRTYVLDHAAFRSLPFAVETGGYMGTEAVRDREPP